MTYLVQTISLRIIYLIFGGIPAIVLSIFCVIYLPSTFSAALNFEAKDQFMAVIGTTLLVSGMLGTVSGWVAFFGIATSTQTGRIVHSICIGAGALTAIYAGWDFLRFSPGGAAGPMALSSAFVGICLLWHLWTHAQQGAQVRDAAKRRPLA